MGLFDKLRSKNAIQVNDLVDNKGLFTFYNVFDFFKKKKNYENFSVFYIWVCFTKILKGLSNVTFTTSKDNFTANSIVNFINDNYTLLFYQYVRYGYIVVKYDVNRSLYYVLDESNIRKDNKGAILNKDAVVVYSYEYQTMRKSPLFMCKPIMSVLDSLSATLDASTHTMNVLPIISGQAIPANPKFKEELSSAMSRDYGFGDDQLKYFLSQTELKVDTIELGVEKLNLSGNIKDKFKELLNYWNIPVVLVLDDASSYNNITEAKRLFYNDCVRFYAEQFLLVAQNLLTASSELLPKSTLNYKITNVPEMENTVSGYCSETISQLELLSKFAECGVYVEDDVQELFNNYKKEIKQV